VQECSVKSEEGNLRFEFRNAPWFRSGATEVKNDKQAKPERANGKRTVSTE
jgi:hypothetical protein